jgi:drug/metabolite transporter (DMT)-like permease
VNITTGAAPRAARQFLPAGRQCSHDSGSIDGQAETVRTALLTALAMVAFAANSILCRLALQGPAIDAASFGSVRLVSGAVALAVIVHLLRGEAKPTQPDWWAAAMLFLYVACFSFAYLYLSAGTGALILFGAVQLTMFLVGLHRGERFRPLAWAGFAMAIAGLAFLLAPGVTAPSPLGAALMAVAGVAWGVYSLRGRGVASPLQATAANFARAVPFALAVSIVFASDFRVSPHGVLLAVASGALTSGIGYVVWYAALRGLAAMSAATVQLSVPVLAAIGGATLLAEEITLRLVVAALATLGGIALVLAQKRTQGG